MSEAQLLATISQIPVNELISFLAAISNRNYPQFEQLGSQFATSYGVEVWEEYFNFRLLPALDNASSNWLLQQTLGTV
jgi:hypothetical protein